jgi:hypothetical protein
VNWELLGREFATRQESTRLRIVIATQQKQIRMLEKRTVRPGPLLEERPHDSARVARLRNGLKRAVGEVMQLRRSLSLMKSRCRLLEHRNRHQFLLLDGLGKLFRSIALSFTRYR